eukprot:GFYU01004959.1.p1 GENE.GFYU01004959.1~~GFYU01004959.1.p1  ORF type:complete len:229 (-),score=36.45 GFYU01004959.1:193-879(-)
MTSRLLTARLGGVLRRTVGPGPATFTRPAMAQTQKMMLPAMTAVSSFSTTPYRQIFQNLAPLAPSDAGAASSSSGTVKASTSDTPTFAIVEVKGHQYKVTLDDIVTTDLASELEVGSTVELHQVLLVGTVATSSIGRPYVQDACVYAEVMEHTKLKKQLIFKKNRRKGYEKTQGHRQQVTRLRIVDIEHNPSFASLHDVGYPVPGRYSPPTAADSDTQSSTETAAAAN